MAPLVADAVPHLSAEGSAVRRAATRCVSEVATADAGAVVGAVPALAATVESGGDADGRTHAIYALCRVADDHPEAVEPVVPALGDVLLDDAVPDGERLNAAAALGHVAGEFPDVALPILGDVAALTGGEGVELRNNALGLLADVATSYPAAVADVARFVDADDAFARINSTGVLSRVAEARPGAVDPYADRLAGRLDDDRPLVRRNVCWALGHVEAEGAVDALDSVAAADGSDEVRARARWAVERTED